MPDGIIVLKNGCGVLKMTLSWRVWRTNKIFLFYTGLITTILISVVPIVTLFVKRDNNSISTFGKTLSDSLNLLREISLSTNALIGFGFKNKVKMGRARDAFFSVRGENLTTRNYASSIQNFKL